MISLCKNNVTLEERRECVKNEKCVINKFEAKGKNAPKRAKPYNLI